MNEYASREGHSKVVNQLSMQKMSIMARTRSQENVLDDLDQNDKIQIEENNANLNNQRIVAQSTLSKKKDKTIKLNDEEKQNMTLNSLIENKQLTVKKIQNEKDNVAINPLIKNEELKFTKLIDKVIQNEKENETLSCMIKNKEELKFTKLIDKVKQNENNMTLASTIICEDNLLTTKLETENQSEKNYMILTSVLDNEINKSLVESSKEVIDNNKVIVEEKNTPTNTVLNKDEESVSQCTIPPPMDPPRSWDFIQTGIMHVTDTNGNAEKLITENIEQVPDPIVGEVNTDDSELEWGSDESLPTDPNQTCNIVENKKEHKKKNTFYNFITTKLLNKNKNRVSASADSVIDGGTTTNKHVRNKSFSSLGTFKLTVPSDVNKALYQLSPEMNFTHSSFSKSKSFNEHIHIENVDNNSVEFERSKSLCLDLKHNYDASESQQRDSDSQSDDSSLRSKRSLLLSMRMPKVHDEHHDDYHLEVKECETSEDEGPHYWYSPNKKNDKIVQQDTVIRNNSDSRDSSE